MGSGSEWTHALRPRRDLPLIGALAVAAIPNALPGLHTYDVRSLDVLGIALLIASFGALAWRRALPLATLALIAAASVGYGLRNYPDSLALGVALVIAIFAAGRYRSDWRRVPVVIAVVVLVPVAGLMDGRQSVTAVITATGVYAVVALIGDRQRLQADRLTMLEDRAVHLEREATEAAWRAAAEERRRVARELHDVIAHSLGVIVVQASAAGHVLAQSEAAAPLHKIETAGRQAIGEMRTLLEVLRNDQPETDYAAVSRLAQLPELVDDTRNAGLDVRLVLNGDARALPALVDLSAYRIIQEGLTNVLKHAPGATVDVVVDHRPDELAITVANRGGHPNGNPSPSGYGLAGMAERVAMLHGQFRAGPQPDGFTVQVVLPLADGSAA